MIVAYVSGHGFGHATRVGEVLRVLRQREPGARLAVVSSSPESLFRRAVQGSLDFRSLECDVGLAQKDALVIDEAATVERWRGFAARWDALVASESRWLRRAGARCVLGDIPPLAFVAAAQAGVPSVALANFSWDWIYRHLSSRNPALGEAASWAEGGYRHAGLLLRLPFAGDLSVFGRMEDIPLVARRPKLDREESRRRLRADHRPLVLVSFGGLRLPGFSVRILGELGEFRFIVSEAQPDVPDNVVIVTAALLDSLGLDYADLVGAADVVVTKPGYGIVSDAIGAGTRIVYTDRGDFPEYPILVEGMARYLPCAYVSNDDLLAGRVREPIRVVLDRPLPAPPDLGGAHAAARRLLEIAS